MELTLEQRQALEKEIEDSRQAEQAMDQALPWEDRPHAEGLRRVMSDRRKRIRDFLEGVDHAIFLEEKGMLDVDYVVFLLANAAGVDLSAVQRRVEFEARQKGDA